MYKVPRSSKCYPYRQFLNGIYLILISLKISPYASLVRGGFFIVQSPTLCWHAQSAYSQSRCLKFAKSSRPYSFMLPACWHGTHIMRGTRSHARQKFVLVAYIPCCHTSLASVSSTIISSSCSITLSDPSCVVISSSV